VLGLAFNWGALVGYTAVVNDIHAPAMLLLYGAGVCWTMVYDTIYAFQDIADDRKIGVRSSALTFEATPRLWLSAFAASSVALLAGAGAVTNAGPVFYGVAVGGAAAHYIWQLARTNLADPAACGRTFVANKWLGLVVFAGIALDKILPLA
jgi:4-hydroxybenzoate polyprenyltransferase